MQGMHQDEVATDVGLVRRLLARRFPRWAGLAIVPVASSGTDNSMYRLGDELVVRMPRIHWAAGDVEREASWLPRLAPLLPVPIPSPLTVGEPGDRYPWHWSVCPWLAGENPTPAELEADGSLAASFARQVAGFIDALHRIDTMGGPVAGRGVPLIGRDGSTRAAISALDGVIDTTSVTDAWDAALDEPAWTGEPVWIHGDISPGNVLWRDRQLSAVIDFGAFGVGDPACDLIVGWNLLPPTARALFRGRLGVDDATWGRGRGWALSIALIQLPYYLPNSPSIVANALRVIDEVLVDSPDN